jgi:hypothetical protein
MYALWNRLPVSTLGVGLCVSCCMVSRCSSWFDLELKSALDGRCRYAHRCSLMSCRRSSRGSSTIHIESFVGVAKIGVAMLGIGFQRRVLWLSYAHLSKSRNLVSAPRRLSSGLSALIRICHVCHPEGHVWLNIIDKIIPKPEIFADRTQDSFRVCDLSSCNLLSETNKFFVVPFFCCA